jgi:signal transduction histidine kinase/GAF domain-containing protein
MERLVRPYFTPRRIADIYARSGQWDEAFRRYALTNTEPKPRPINREDRADVAAVLQALSGTLHSEAANSIEAVKNRFEQGCRWVLGFKEVSFWVRNKTWEQQVDLNSAEASPGSLESVKELPGQGAVTPGPWPLSNERGLCAALGAVRADCTAVLVGDFSEGRPLSRERYELARRFLQDFVSAHSHAVFVQRSKLRLEARNKHARIINDILSAMSHDVLDVGYVIKLAARSLRALNYQRVLFCLVDTQRKWIRGIYDSAKDSRVDLTMETEYELSEPTKDIQPYIVSTGKAMIVEDAATEPLTNKDLVHRAGIKNMAIVPIKDKDGLVIGTIHVERDDGRVPTKDEAEDLELFASQLSTAIQHSERVHLMQYTLDQLPDPILIYDPQGQNRYANLRAAELFGVARQWHIAQVPVKDQAASNAARTALDHGLSFSSVEEIAGEPYDGELTAQQIVDWRGQSAGAFVYLHDLNDHFRSVRAFERVATATDENSALSGLIEAAKELGHPWVRIYFKDKSDEGALVSERGFGFTATDRFNRRQTKLTRGTVQGDRGWLSIDQRKPMLFCFNPDKPEGEEGKTALGIRFWWAKVQDADPALRKELGQCWLDFPLVTKAKQVLGKVSLGCDLNLSRQEFETLGVMSDWLANVLAAFRERDRAKLEKERSIEKAAEMSLAVMAHSMHAEFGSFGALLGRYRLKERHIPEIHELNAEFRADYQRLLGAARIARDKLGSFQVRPALISLSDVLRSVMLAHLPDPAQYDLECDSEAIIEADRGLLEGIVTELIGNAKKAVDRERLKISVNLQDRAEFVFFTFRDNGPGVPDADKSRIFENFFHRYTGGDNDGLGLGLSRVKRVVEAHGGQITEKGEHGNGALFEIRLPRSVSLKACANV